MNLRSLAALSIGIALAAGPGVAAEWVVDAQASSLEFSGVQTGAPFNGGFDTFAASITFDPENLAEARIEVRVDTASFNSHSTDRDGLAVGEDWFAVDMFPEAVFLAEQVTHTGENGYLAEGMLTIRDASVPLAVPFALDIVEGRAVADGTLVLDRFAFGLGQRDFADPGLVDAAVGVTFHIEATQ